MDLDEHATEPADMERRLFLPQPFLAVIALLIALLFIATAAWGWGDWRGMLAHPARGAAAVMLCLLALLTPLCGCHVNVSEMQVGGNDWVFLPLIATGLAMGWISAWCDRHHHWTLGGDSVRAAGLMLFLMGSILRVGSILTLGPRFTVWVAIQPGHRLATGGLYRFVRHPSYTGAILTLAGWALVYRSIAGLLLVALMVPPLLARIGAEEALLHERFGEKWTRYRSGSWRLLPGIY